MRILMRFEDLFINCNSFKNLSLYKLREIAICTVIFAISNLIGPKLQFRVLRGLFKEISLFLNPLIVWLADKLVFGSGLKVTMAKFRLKNSFIKILPRLITATSKSLPHRIGQFEIYWKPCT